MIPPKHPFVKKIADALHHRCKIPKSPTGLLGPSSHTRLLVATSGGCDSVALLTALTTLARTRRWKLQLNVAHIQHHLRDSAETDAVFVADLARQLGLSFWRRDLDLTPGNPTPGNIIPGNPSPGSAPPGKPPPGTPGSGNDGNLATRDHSAPAGNLEARARDARYAALASIATESESHHIVTAHHADDQLETMLMRMMRGSSVRGLSCMNWRRRLRPGIETLSTASTGDPPEPRPDRALNPLWLIRPMLAVDRSAVLKYLNDIDQPWREDPTNLDRSRLRARLRHEVLPSLHRIDHRSGQRAVELADHFRKVNRVLERRIDQAETQVILTQHPITIDRPLARSLEILVLTGLLHRVLHRAGVGADRLSNQTLDPILNAVSDQEGRHRSFDLDGGVRVIVTREKLEIQTSSR